MEPVLAFNSNRTSTINYTKLTLRVESGELDESVVVFMIRLSKFPIRRLEHFNVKRVSDELSVDLGDRVASHHSLQAFLSSQFVVRILAFFVALLTRLEELIDVLNNRVKGIVRRNGYA